MERNKQPDYENMSDARLRNTYIERCDQQGASAGANIPKTRSRLIQAIMEKDILLALGGFTEHADKSEKTILLLGTN